MADPVWIRSERPDGHRSLWCMSSRWIMIEVASLVPDRLWIGIVGEDLRTCTAAEHLGAPCRMYYCPTPTPADLAWLRGS